jgi:uncharacterized protein
MAKAPDFDKARNYALGRLEHELSPSLIYHSLKHTQEEVVPAADMLANLEMVGEEDLLLLLTAVYFHDLGYIRQRQDHESISIQLAEQNLPRFGYSDSQIAIIRGIIRATRLPQSPTNLLERIMADADLDYLGHESFWKRNDDFRHELENFGSSFTDEEWCSHQLQFMQSHRYFTESARLLRDTQKQQNILEMKQLLDQAIQLKMN